MRDISLFRSSQFSPFLPEESQVNPGVYGAELAYWLSAQLAAQGVITSYPESEDWGWHVQFITDEGSEFAVHCSNTEGARDRWLLSLRRYGRKLFGRDKPPYSQAAPLIEAIRHLLHSTPFVEDIRWVYD